MHTREILVIDDDPAMVRLMADILKDAGFRATSARDGEEALVALRTFRLDVVVSDIMMPGLNGLELLAIVKHRNPGVEVLLVTGYATRAIAHEAWRTGACGLLEKPFTPEQLVDAVNQAVLRYRLRQPTTPTRTTPASLRPGSSRYAAAG